MELTAEQADLVERYISLVRPVVRSVRRGAATLDDSIGEGYLTLCEAAIAYRGDRGVPFGSYAAAAIRNRMIDMIRHEARFAGRRPVAFSQMEAAGGDAWQPADPRSAADDRMEWVRDEMDGMSARTRRVVRMRLDGWLFREIAEDCRTTRAVARSLHSHAVQLMRRRAARRGGDS